MLINASYRKLFKLPGAIGFCAAAFVGRIPAGMIGLAIILPLSALTGSYMIAGVVAAFTMLGMAFCAPMSGRLIDRYGQYRILLIFASLNFLATAALIAAIHYHAPLILLCLIGMIAGASRLSTGTMSRVRWAHILSMQEPEQQKTMLQAAYAFEGIVDEIVFISAPIIAVLLCTAIHPLAGLICCLITFVVGAIALAVQRRTQPPVAAVHERQLSVFRLPALRVIFAAILCIGMSAGAVEVIVVARADVAHSRHLAGLLIATLALSSMLSGFWYGARTFKLGAHKLWLRCLALLVISLVPFVFSANLWVLFFVMFIAGLSIAPASIAGQVLTERIVPFKQLTEGMNITVTAMILGMAIGGWLAGVLIDHLGVSQAGVLPALATLVALIIAIAGMSSLEHCDKP